MAKEVVEAMVTGGKATAGPPLGPALGPKGVNIGQVIAEINKKTEAMKGMTVPVKVIIDTDTKSFEIEIGTPPTSALLIKEALLDKGSGKAKGVMVGDLKIDQVISIAKVKQSGLLAQNLKAAVLEVIGTCTSAGIMVEGMHPRDAIKAVKEGKWADKISEKVLDNGLKIICLKKSDTPVVSAQIWYKAGSMNEHDGVRGISHVLEHMMFRGSENVAAEEHAQRVNDVGGHCNAFTAEDITSYVNSVPKDHLSMVLELEADRMENLTLDKDIFDTRSNKGVEGIVNHGPVVYRQELLAGNFGQRK